MRSGCRSAVFASRETERAMRQVQWQTTETDEATRDEGSQPSLSRCLTIFDTRARVKESTVCEMTPLLSSRPSSIRWRCFRCTPSAPGSQGCAASAHSRRGTWRCHPLLPVNGFVATVCSLWRYMDSRIAAVAMTKASTVCFHFDRCPSQFYTNSNSVDRY
jgi:hypothetical protein